MNEEEQIDEMARDLASSIVWQDLYDDEVTVDTKATSVKMRDKGYRKASDVAREIIETLESGMEEPITEWHKGYFAALSDVVSILKKKYLEDT